MENYKHLIEFLDKQFQQDSMKFQTARTRKTAIRKVFENSSYRDANIITLNLDDLMEEFRSNLEVSIKEDTFNTYKSRINRSIEDYIRIEKLGDKPKKEHIKESIVVEKKVTTIEVQCPIRNGDFIIDIKNLPINLNKEELDKLIEMIKVATK
jgi:hypothetical protein